MQVELDLILHMGVCVGQERQQVGDISAYLLQRVGRDQLIDERRLTRCGRLQRVSTQ